MIEALSHSLRDPIRYAPPFFLLIIVIELATLAPSHHRVRHGSDQFHLDRNYATYGLTTTIDSNNLVHLQFHEYAAVLRDIGRAKRFRDRLGYVFGPPGWQPAVPEGAAPDATAARADLTTAAP